MYYTVKWHWCQDVFRQEFPHAASPVAVPVKWPEAHTLENNQWVKVFGRTDPEAGILAADKVEPIREPDNPYM
ncbi:MAG: hypothetical protein WBD05_07790 [Phycisphaerae bacterium]